MEARTLATHIDETSDNCRPRPAVGKGVESVGARMSRSSRLDRPCQRTPAITRRVRDDADRCVPYDASAGSADPTTWNRYSYTWGDPINFRDPIGLKPEGPGDPPDEGEEQPRVRV